MFTCFLAAPRNGGEHTTFGGTTSGILGTVAPRHPARHEKPRNSDPAVYFSRKGSAKTRCPKTSRAYALTRTLTRLRGPLRGAYALTRSPRAYAGLTDTRGAPARARAELARVLRRLRRAQRLRSAHAVMRNLRAFPEVARLPGAHALTRSLRAALTLSLRADAEPMRLPEARALTRNSRAHAVLTRLHGSHALTRSLRACAELTRILRAYAKLTR